MAVSPQHTQIYFTLMSAAVKTYYQHYNVSLTVYTWLHMQW